MKPKNKIYLTEEVELTEREQRIYDAGVSKGRDDGFYLFMIIFIGVIGLVTLIEKIFY